MDSKDRESFIMNSKQLKVLWIAIILITLMVIFPPWVGAKRNENEKFIGFHFIFSQPKYKVFHGESYRVVNGKREAINPKAYNSHHDYINSRIDLNRFLIQVIPFILIAGGLMYTWKDKNIKKIKDESTPVISKNDES
jgi:hypothetical protein